MLHAAAATALYRQSPIMFRIFSWRPTPASAPPCVACPHCRMAGLLHHLTHEIRVGALHQPLPLVLLRLQARGRLKQVDVLLQRHVVGVGPGGPGGARRGWARSICWVVLTLTGSGALTGWRLAGDKRPGLLD